MFLEYTNLVPRALFPKNIHRLTLFLFTRTRRKIKGGGVEKIKEWGGAEDFGNLLEGDHSVKVKQKGGGEEGGMGDVKFVAIDCFIHTGG